MDKSFKAKLAALEAIEAAQLRPSYVCMHARDFDALDNPATPRGHLVALADAYQLGDDQQKLYVGCCLCDPGESCRVCTNRPVLTT